MAPRPSPLYLAIGAVSLPVMKLLFRPRSTGVEHVPAEGGCVLAANHLSNFDPWAIGLPLYPRRFLRFMGKSELFWWPLGPIIQAGGAFKVRRGQADAEAIETAEQLCREGHVVVMFPEGTRRKKGLADAAKKAHREAKDGVVTSYIHPGAKIGVLVEVNCETDFVARTEDFQQLVKDVAMQVAAANPSYVSREDVPGAVVEKEREIYRTQMADQKKPPQVIDKIIEGKLEKFYAESCLMEQPFIRDASGKTRLRDMVDQATAKMGERIVVKRFARFQVGES